MTRFSTNLLAAVAAVFIAATSFAAVVTVPEASSAPPQTVSSGVAPALA